MGIAGIWAALTPELSKLQADVVAAATPFMIATATIDAFTAGHGNPSFDTALIDYVSGFVAHGVGASFDPHVSTGIAAIDYLDRIVAEPFLPFAFAPASAAVYQLGPFGTAARLLKRWDAASRMARRRGQAGDPRFRDARDDRWPPGFRAARRQDRRVRQ
jgi:hypothetical protein